MKKGLGFFVLTLLFIRTSYADTSLTKDAVSLESMNEFSSMMNHLDQEINVSSVLNPNPTLKKFEETNRQIEELLNTDSSEEWADNYKKEEFLLSFLLKIPEPYKQYVIPSVHTSPFLSVKTRTHPEIKKYRGKKPTRIAPELEEWAKKYLDNLPPELYPALMPEAWPSFYKEHAPEMPEEPIHIDFPKLMAEGKNREIKSFGSRPRNFTFPEEYDKPLTDEKIDSLLQIADKLKALTKEENFERRRAKMVQYTLLQSLEEMTENSCGVLEDGLYYAGYGPKFEQILAETNMSQDDFTPLCNRLMHAYRVEKLPIQKAAGFGKIRRELIQDMTGPRRRLAALFLKLYSAPFGDVQQVKGKRGRIFDAFTEDRSSFLFLSVPMFLN